MRRGGRAEPDYGGDGGGGRCMRQREGVRTEGEQRGGGTRTHVDADASLLIVAHPADLQRPTPSASAETFLGRRDLNDDLDGTLGPLAPSRVVLDPREHADVDLWLVDRPLAVVLVAGAGVVAVGGGPPRSGGAEPECEGRHRQGQVVRNFRRGGGGGERGAREDVAVCKGREVEGRVPPGAGERTAAIRSAGEPPRRFARRTKGVG